MEARDVVEPLRGVGFRTILMSYPHTREALKVSDSIVAASSVTEEQISRMIDPYSASDEVFAHLFIEKFLEFAHPDWTPEQSFEFGKEAGLAAEPDESQAASLID